MVDEFRGFDSDDRDDDAGYADEQEGQPSDADIDETAQSAILHYTDGSGHQGEEDETDGQAVEYEDRFLSDFESVQTLVNLSGPVKVR